MIEIKEGDYVLVDHSFLQDTYQVRKVDKVMNVTCILSRPTSHSDNFAEPGRRNRAAIKGVFKDKQQAINAIAPLKELKLKLHNDERALKRTFHQACRDLCK